MDVSDFKKYLFYNRSTAHFFITVMSQQPLEPQQTHTYTLGRLIKPKHIQMVFERGSSDVFKAK